MTAPKATAVEKAALRHEKACCALENAQHKEAEAFENLKEEIEEERHEALRIYRPEGCLR